MKKPIYMDTKTQEYLDSITPQKPPPTKEEKIKSLVIEFVELDLQQFDLATQNHVLCEIIRKVKSAREQTLAKATTEVTELTKAINDLPTLTE